MASRMLSNYLISNRKRLALSQDEVAFLLGSRGGEKISLYEKFKRVPSLKAALALEAMYKVSVSELFGGLYREIDEEVAGRAKVLLFRKDRKANARAAHRRKSLTNIAGKKM
jgi:transcriptional regulator with XRE-family HTH domain